MNFVSIDFETANQKRFSPCSIGIVIANENGILDEFYSLINPLMDFDTYNTYIHGIADKDVMNAPVFDELWPEISHFFDGNLIIAHNASFDMSVLRHTLDRYQLSYPICSYLCTVMLSKRVWSGLDNYKLNTLANYNNITFRHHNALEDARVAAQLVVKAIDYKKSNSILDLVDGCNIKEGKLFDKGYTAPKVQKTKVSSKSRM